MSCSTFMQNVDDVKKNLILFQLLICPYISFPVSTSVKRPVSVGKENGITTVLVEGGRRSRFYPSFSPLPPPSFSAAWFPIPSLGIED